MFNVCRSVSLTVLGTLMLSASNFAIAEVPVSSKCYVSPGLLFNSTKPDKLADCAEKRLDKKCARLGYKDVRVTRVDVHFADEKDWRTDGDHGIAEGVCENKVEKKKERFARPEEVKIKPEQLVFIQKHVSTDGWGNNLSNPKKEALADADQRCYFWGYKYARKIEAYTQKQCTSRYQCYNSSLGRAWVECSDF